MSEGFNPSPPSNGNPVGLKVGSKDCEFDKTIRTTIRSGLSYRIVYPMVLLLTAIQCFSVEPVFSDEKKYTLKWQVGPAGSEGRVLVAAAVEPTRGSPLWNG